MYKLQSANYEDLVCLNATSMDGCILLFIQYNSCCARLTSLMIISCLFIILYTLLHVYTCTCTCIIDYKSLLKHDTKVIFYSYMYMYYTVFSMYSVYK